MIEWPSIETGARPYIVCKHKHNAKYFAQQGQKARISEGSHNQTSKFQKFSTKQVILLLRILIIWYRNQAHKP